MSSGIFCEPDVDTAHLPKSSLINPEPSPSFSKTSSLSLSVLMNFSHPPYLPCSPVVTSGPHNYATFQGSVNFTHPDSKLNLMHQAAITTGHLVIVIAAPMLRTEPVGPAFTV